MKKDKIKLANQKFKREQRRRKKAFKDKMRVINAHERRIKKRKKEVGYVSNLIGEV